MKFLLLLTVATYLFAQTIHSSVSSYYETKNFTNSKQKNDAIVYGVGADIHSANSAYKIAYEQGDTDTKKSPKLTEDLETAKLFLQYSYKVDDKLSLNINYINILEDNIAITQGGQTYGLGIGYKFNIISLHINNFYTQYDDFNVNQIDTDIEYKTALDTIQIKFNLLTKYIQIDDTHINSFTQNADENYFTTGAKFHLHYQGYHFGSAIYLGKRAFSVMNDGFKIQHHAMEFHETYAIGLGKNISNFVIRLQYTYATATELPINNKNVKISNTKFLLNYKF